jgi:hypothetical protein
VALIKGASDINTINRDGEGSCADSVEVKVTMNLKQI